MGEWFIFDKISVVFLQLVSKTPAGNQLIKHITCLPLASHWQVTGRFNTELKLAVTCQWWFSDILNQHGICWLPKGICRVSADAQLTLYLKPFWYMLSTFSKMYNVWNYQLMSNMLSGDNQSTTFWYSDCLTPKLQNNQRIVYRPSADGHKTICWWCADCRQTKWGLLDANKRQQCIGNWLVTDRKVT